MTTPWTLPTTISQYAEEGAETIHIPWDESTNFDNLRSLDQRFVETTKPLMHIARSPKHDITMKTYYIRASGFVFQDMPETLSGIEVRITSNRRGRIADDTIQLSLNNLPIGDNCATVTILPVKIYGSSSDLWGTSSLNINDVQQDSFGVIVRFQSHLHWPHCDPAFIGAIEMRIH